MKLEGKIALVTGATRGLGKAMAERLAREGATVVVTGRDAARAAEVAREIAAGGARAFGFRLEVSDAESVAELLRQVEDQVGAVDILVNNAGVTRDTLLLRMSDEEWDEVIRVNLTGAYRLAKGVLRGMMKKRWGGSSTFPPSSASSAIPGRPTTPPPKRPSSGLPRAWPGKWPAAASRSTRWRRALSRRT